MSCLVQRSLKVLEVAGQRGWGCCLEFGAPRASRGPCLPWAHSAPPRIRGRACHLTEEDFRLRLRQLCRDGKQQADVGGGWAPTRLPHQAAAPPGTHQHFRTHPPQAE